MIIDPGALFFGVTIPERHFWAPSGAGDRVKPSSPSKAAQGLIRLGTLQAEKGALIAGLDSLNWML